jgi:hypothetical protein
MRILGMEPIARLGVVAADERVETPVEPEEEKRQLPFLGVRIETASVLEAGEPTLRSSR